MVEQLILHQGDSEAYLILRDAIKQQPSPEILPLLTQLDLPDHHPVIVLLEGLVKNIPIIQKSIVY